MWSDEVVRYFIDCVRGAPYMWNVRSPQYKSKYKKAHFWKEAAGKLNAKFNLELTGIECSKKWHNLKSYYLVERNRILNAARKASPADALEASQNRWRFIDKLDFLTAGVVTTNSHSNLIINKPEDNISIDHSNDMVTEDERNPSCSPPMMPTPMFHTAKREIITPSPSQERIEAQISENYRLMSACLNKLPLEQSNARTAEDVFGEFVALKLKALPAQVRMVAESEIMELLFKHHGQYLDEV